MLYQLQAQDDDNVKCRLAEADLHFCISLHFVVEVL